MSDVRLVVERAQKAGWWRHSHIITTFTHMLLYLLYILIAFRANALVYRHTKYNVNMWVRDRQRIQWGRRETHSYAKKTNKSLPAVAEHLTVFYTLHLIAHLCGQKRAITSSDPVDWSMISSCSLHNSTIVEKQETLFSIFFRFLMVFLVLEPFYPFSVDQSPSHLVHLWDNLSVVLY